MKIFNRILKVALIIIILTITLGNNLYITVGASVNYQQKLPVRIGFFTRDINDDYIMFLRKGFEDIQKNNPGKVVFSFYNANFDESTQNTDMENALKKGIDLILLDAVNLLELRGLISKIEEYNVPVVVFNRIPFTLDAIKFYKKAFYVGSDSVQAGMLQGKMIVNAWKNHKELIDKNNDGVLQYIMLVGEELNETAINRSAYSILTIQETRIKTENLASPILGWSKESAFNTMSALLIRYDKKIEAIISNDDTMAIGAVQALQNSGYNKGNKLRSIPVVGVDGVSEAKELISKGFMLGTASQDPVNIVNAIYKVGMNLVYGRNPIEGISKPYILDESGVAVYFPYEEYTGPMFK